MRQFVSLLLKLVPASPLQGNLLRTTAGIVIVLGKLGRGGTEDETVKLLKGIQRV